MGKLSGSLRVEGRLANQAQKITRTRSQAVATQPRSPLRFNGVKMLPGTAAPGHSMPKPHTLPTAAASGRSFLGLAVVNGLLSASVSLYHSP